MARFQTAGDFSIRALDFHRLAGSGDGSVFGNDVFEENGKRVVEDVYIASWVLDGREYGTAFLGSGFEVDRQGMLVAGAVETVLEVDGQRGRPIWGIDTADTPLDAAEILAAILTEETGDDLELIAEVLSGRDRIRLGDGVDRMNGFDGGDLMLGGGGADTLGGGRGKDRIEGGRGADTLYGDGGADRLLGQGGRDRLLGGTGDDWLDGGRGVDRMDGGAGADSFVFSAGYGRDVVTDFEDDIDGIALDGALWTRDLTARQVLKRFASDTGDDVVLDFGEDRLVVRGIADRFDLVDDLTIA